MSVNRLILGDNLEILKTEESETVDLIYLDPPFFSNRNYEVIWGDEGEVRSFQDRWAGGIDHYIAWLKERVVEMHRILKPTGSIFLHCDWHANAYIRVEILDRIFGMNNLRNEILWCYMGPGSPGVKQFLKKHDTIFWYSKSDTWTFNLDDVRFPHSEKTKENFKSGLEGSGFDGAPKEINEKGKVPEDWWIDVTIAARFPKNSENNLGYPTQKPVKLLERIIKAASNTGDIVLDPFVGGGTTVAVADKLNRKWIGIDQSVQAIKVTELRLDKQRDLFSAPFTVQLHKYDYDTLRYKNAFEFESWIVQQFGGVNNVKQRGDFGLDGKMPDNTPIQVKRSDNVGRNVIDNFFAAVQRSDKKLFDKNVAGGKPVGYIIAFSFGKGAVEEVARLKLKENIIIELVTVDKIVPIAMKPTLTIEINELDRDVKGIREIEFIAAGRSESGIEFYSWDFEYNPEKGFRASVIIDKDGKQQHKLKAGLHNIAVKVVDNDGLENTEIIKLKVNGIIERTE
jgi:DNA modification methylase